MKQLLISALFLPMIFSVSAQTTHFVTSPGSHLDNSAQIVVLGVFENQGSTSNDGEISVGSDVQSEGDYQGFGTLKLFTNQQTEIYCADTINHLIVDKPGSSISVPADLFVLTSFDLQSGIFDLEGQTLHLGSESVTPLVTGGSSTAFVRNGPVKLHFSGSSLLHFPLGENLGTPLDITINTVDPGSHWINMELENASHPQMPTTPDHLSIYWSVAESGIGAIDADIQISYNDLEVVGDENLLYLNSFENPTWTGPIASGADVEVGAFSGDSFSNQMTWAGVPQIQDFAAFSWSAPCPLDLNNDGQISTGDLLILLSEFGCSMACLYDITGDDATNTQDLLFLLSAFGQPCP